MSHLRLFISSPGDVGEERRLAARVIERLQFELGPRVDLDPIFWEHEPLRATGSFQEQIPLPSEADVVVCILWSRLGTRLPERFSRPDGSRFSSGTEFELEDALRAYRERGIPDLLVYRKTSRPVADLDSEEQVLERLAQKKALDAFVTKWFRSADGSFTAAFHTFETASRFEEMLEEHLRKVIDDRLRRQPSAGEPAPQRPRWQRGTPFRGLRTFEPEHAPIFCGRTSQVSDVLNALRRQAAAGKPFVLITGMSGCGKSSLVRAGVLPELTYPNVIEGIGLWRYAVLVPGNSAGGLFDGLAEALLEGTALKELRQSGTGIHELALLLRERPATAVPLLRSGLSQAAREVQRVERLEREPTARLALVIDQMEEIFTVERFTAAEREKFDAALGALAKSGAVWVLATLRSDFYARCAELPELMSLKEGAGQYDLRAPAAAEIGQIIRQPARVAGLRFEEDPRTGERLDDVLRDAAVKDPAALPLLEFTLDELYKRRTDDGLLTFAAYRELEGVEGALAHRAEEVFSALRPATQAALPALLSALVALGAEEDDSLVRRRAPLAAVTATPEDRALVDAFVDSRLLVTDQAHDGSAVVSVAHEALLRHWPRARQWLADNREMLRTRARIKSAAALWRQEGEGGGFLIPPGKLLRDGEALLAAGGGHLDEVEAQLVRASLAAEREGRRSTRLKRWAAAAAALALVLVGLVAWWLFLKKDVTYYTAWIKKNGVPVGVGPVDADEVRHRQWTLRFTKEGTTGPVVRVEAVNSSGHLTPYHGVEKYLGNTDPSQYLLDLGRRPCAWAFDYDREDRLLGETGYNCAGKAVYEFLYKGKPEEGRIFTAEFAKGGIATPQARSGAALVKFTRDENGFDKKIRYLDSAGRPKPGLDASFGLGIEELDDQGRGLPTSVVNLGPDGHPAPHRDGWFQTKIRYDELGRPVEQRYFDRQGRLRRTRHGFAKVKIGYDPHGNVGRLELFDEDDRPMRGVAVHENSYDERGNLVRAGFLNAEGRPAYQAEGHCGFVQEHDRRGNVTSQAYLDEHGRPTATQYGIGRIRLAYDKSNNVTQVSFFDEKGKPIPLLGGVTKFVWKYDDAGNRVEERHLDARDRLIRTNSGYAWKQMWYAPDGEQVEEAYFDEQDYPARNELGVMRWRLERDPEARTEKRRFLDDAGEPMFSKKGAAQVWRAFDELGRPVEESYHDADGDLVRTEDGFAILRTEFDSQGVPSKVSYFDEASQPVHVSYHYQEEDFDVAGCAGLDKRYDARGKLTEATCLDEQGQITSFADGYSKVRIHYDERGHRVGMSFLDKSGEPQANGQGFARVRWRCDRFGNRIEETYLGPQGEPVLHPGGYAKVRRKFDPWGLTIEESYLDGNGQLVRRPEGYARFTSRYGVRGEPLEAMFFDEQGQRVRTSLGYAHVLFRYDRAGNQVERSFRDEFNEPVRVGPAKIESDYDLSGRPVRHTYLDRGGRVLKVENVGSPSLPAPPQLAAAAPGPAPAAPAAPAIGDARKPARPSGRKAETRAEASTSYVPPSEPAKVEAPAAAAPDPAPAVSADDLGGVVSSLVATSEQILETYEEFLDREEREEEELLERLEEFAEKTEELQKAFRRATGQGGGFRNALGLNRPGNSQATALLRQRSQELARLGANVDALSRTYPLGPQASAQWQQIRRDLARLDALLP